MNDNGGPTAQRFFRGANIQYFFIELKPKHWNLEKPFIFDGKKPFIFDENQKSLLISNKMTHLFSTNRLFRRKIRLESRGNLLFSTEKTY